MAKAKKSSSSSSSKVKPKLKSKLKKSSTPNPATTSTTATTSKIEQLIIELSKKEAEQNEKRQRCSEIVDEMKFHQEKIQSLRDEVQNTTEELQTLDDEITNLQKSKDRFVTLLDSGNGNSDCNSRKKNGNESRDSTGCDNDDELDTHTQYPQNLTQYVGDENDINRNNNGYHDDNYNGSTTAASLSTHRVESSNKSGKFISDNGDGRVSGSNDRRYNPNNHVPDDEINNDDIEDHYRDEHPPDYLFENHNDDEKITEHGLEPWSPPPEQQQRQQQQSQIGNHREQHYGMESQDHNGSLGTWNNNSSIHATATVTSAATSAATMNTNSASSSNHNSQQQNVRGGTLDHYFQRPATAAATSSSSSASIFPPSIQQQLNTTSSSSSAVSAAPSSLNNHNFHAGQRPTVQQRNEDYLQKLSSDTFQWSNFVYDLLHNTFKIRSFRDHQKQIINCTLSGDDVFVIMRTGGGKSLTYQLPALLEGRSQSRKITLVVSPLLSLIQDQEEQMNEFAKRSAVSFTSGIGREEQVRRWNLVRDPNSGICIMFVTPERVYKSNKLRSELEKLSNNGRLGRFVIDECHCACQWGHDFRPDYTKLGILKQHFPHVPLIAVTATASNRVREDCCRILRLGTNYQFFRSSANRPNLKYSVKIKPDGKDKVIEEMSKFIKDNHKNGAGIIYTFSKKDANTVADKLNQYGISARPYHSDISTSAKESIHRSWMRNRTQVVVATIAFGLGINKPDVRFVFHHSLSKSLEAYYQESGRAGRDGGQADCVLYYSVKDISRMVGMIHGEVSEPAFWSMVRYSQQHGDDSLCRRIILSILGEPGCENIDHVLADNTSSMTEEREVGQYAKDVVRLIQWSAKDLTIGQVVTLWRGKREETPDFIKENSPGSSLNKEECERLLVALILADVLHPKVVFTSYSSIVYLGLKDNAAKLLSSTNPKVKVRFPLRSEYKSSPAKKTTSKTTETDGGGWLSKKKKKSPKGTSTRKSTSNKKKAPRANSKRRSSTISNVISNLEEDTQPEVINILDDSDDELVSRKRPSRLSATSASKKIRSTDYSLFDSDSSSENEF